MLKINKFFLENISAKAKKSERKRMHHNFHKSYDEKVQRLVNACEPDTYIRPHKHDDSGTIETLLLIKGKILIVIFDDLGKIKEHIILDKEKENFAVELYPDEWHTIISLEENSAIYEIKEGPFDEKKAKHFATWAPKESEEELAMDYLNGILKKLGLE